MELEKKVSSYIIRDDEEIQPKCDKRGEGEITEKNKNSSNKENDKNLNHDYFTATLERSPSTSHQNYVMKWDQKKLKYEINYKKLEKWCPYLDTKVMKNIEKELEKVELYNIYQNFKSNSCIFYIIISACFLLLLFLMAMELLSLIFIPVFISILAMCYFYLSKDRKIKLLMLQRKEQMQEVIVEINKEILRNYSMNVIVGDGGCWLVLRVEIILPDSLKDDLEEEKKSDEGTFGDEQSLTGKIKKKKLMKKKKIIEAYGEGAEPEGQFTGRSTNRSLNKSYDN